ncbi:hypothetical protein ECB98_23610 [Brucellaceae bacterium VT-16-1752]|nr:hypothetical protein ECB98_23610 [Brucellaceae bacterium VT-16-1752]
MIHPDIAPAMSAGIFLQFVRRSIADEIERLISILDQIDGDADLEPSLGEYSPFGVDVECDKSDFEPDEEGGYEEEPYDGFAREYWEARA